MPRFRKKPIEIDAIRFSMWTEDGDPVFETEPPEWLLTAMQKDDGEEGCVDWTAAGIEITTLEGVVTAQPGDWIIRGVEGELYPCKPSIFAASYDEVETKP